ncbi:MAG: ribosome-associated translation inhibitor RaiA [Betaproteobacteria bacterium]|nr:ribosome-associated translation inhibitor RaiA [Betaproteobacteria bacterium]MBK8741649.1 ribosome-associated translation inhibitor RaiA [Betaproteobacteria bacterium]MBK9606556.1 ribosome-associated translation inhibitor RaiA [Betaproteobacteria bacterium]
MRTPPTITMRHMPQSEALEARILKKVAKLEEFHPEIISCAVTIEEERRHQQQGRLFKVRIVVHAPDHDVVVNRDNDEDPYVALRDAFDAVARQLADRAQQLADRARLQRGTMPPPE